MNVKCQYIITNVYTIMKFLMVRAEIIIAKG